MEAYAAQQIALRRNASHPGGEQQQHCDQLVAAAPGVEELRINHGSVESRRWTLLVDGPSPRWTFVRPQASPIDGWAPKPGIDKLNFQPRLEPALAARSNLFLAYAPIERDSLAESQESASANEAFGPALGNFSWRGRKYSYTLTSALPCFPTFQ